MTVDVLTDSAADAEEFVVAWLAPLGDVAFKRRADDPLPFRVVRRIAGTDDDLDSLDTATVSVHTFCDAADPSAAKVECKRTHQRMLLIARNPLTDVTLQNGTVVNVEWLEVTENPIWVDYQDDSILRKVGRYSFGLPFVAG